MKKLQLLLVLLSFSINGIGQESFKKKYYIQDTIKFKNGDAIFLKKDSVIMFKNMTREEQDSIKKKYEGIDYVEITTEEMINDKKVSISKKVKVDSAFYEKFSKTRADLVTGNGIWGFVKFEEDGKIIINRYLTMDSNSNYTRFPIYYYKLENRQTVKLLFHEGTVSALTLPFKYRRKWKDSNLKEDLSTAINGNIFFGYSVGKTSFFHQEKVGNKSNTWKLTAGLLVGASSVVLDKNNTDLTNHPINGDAKFNKGIASLALGVTLSFNKINLGGFYGSDYLIQNGASDWNYNKKPWIGIAVGYSIINF